MKEEQEEDRKKQRRKGKEQGNLKRSEAIEDEKLKGGWKEMEEK